MSSNATEGARPSAAPPREAPTAEGACVAPVEAGPAGGAPTEGAVDTAAPAEAAPDAAVQAEGAVDTAAPAEGAPEADHEFAEHEFTEPGFEEPGFEAPEYAEAHFAGPDYTEPDYAEPRYAEPGSQPVSKLAIVSLVTGLVALVPIAIASGVAALIGIHRTGRGGHGLAMAGLFLSAAWVIIAAAIGTVGLVTHGFHKPVTIKYREAAVFSLHEGDCVDSPNAQLVSILPCSTPHEAEVFATFALPASPWPGTTAIATAASSGCGSRLDSYLNPQLAISLTQSFVYPDRVAWTAGTRTVVCEVRASTGQLTGSVRGATLAQS
jgi:hypothetical protein